MLHKKYLGSDRKMREGENLEESIAKEGKHLETPSIFQEKTNSASFEALPCSLGRHNYSYGGRDNS